MVRLARVYEIKPVWFWRLFWMVDFRSVDRQPAAGLLHIIAEKTATSFERTLATTLAGLSEEGYGVAGNRRYCRECLATDPEPYFRRRWQFRAFLLCDMHGIPLSTGCYRRGHDLTPELVPLERDSIAWCLKCDEDLRIDSGDRFTPCRPASQVLDWEKRLWMLLADSQMRGSGDSGLR